LEVQGDGGVAKNRGESAEMEIGQLTDNDGSYKNGHTKIMKDWYSKNEMLPYGFKMFTNFPQKMFQDT
jgi:hypothetical protein